MVFSPHLGLKNPDFRPMHQVIGNAVAFRYFAAQQKRAFILPILLQFDGLIVPRKLEPPFYFCWVKLTIEDRDTHFA
jgi:hypothetical protein